MASATDAAASRSRWVGNPLRSPHETHVPAPRERAETGRPLTHTQTHTHSKAHAHAHRGARALAFTLAHAHPAPHGEGATRRGQALLTIGLDAHRTKGSKESGLTQPSPGDHVSFKFSSNPNPHNSRAGDILTGRREPRKG